MSNFVETFKQGLAGLNFGLSTGIPALDEAINGLQRKTSIGLVAAPKVGKTTFADFAFVINPYLYLESIGKLNDVQFIYFSYEIDRISKEFKYAAFFMAYDFQVYNFMYKGKLYLMTKDYLMGKLIHREGDNKEPILVTVDHQEMLKTIYLNRIIPLFGEYDATGRKIREGKIRFISEPDNPTGMYKFLLKYARATGTVVEESFTTLNDKGKDEVKTRVVSYTPNNPNIYTIIITDHIRKLRRERGFNMKENVDKWLEYSTELRNLCSFVFINVAHSNRGIANIDRLKFAGEFIFPTADDVKDTGNLAEESTILMTLFNPNDEKYNLDRHFGLELKEYPNYRSLHITESRDTECPAHIQLNMYGGINMFEGII